MKKIIISASLAAVMFLMLLNIGGGMLSLPKMAIPIAAAILTGVAVYFLIDFFENYQKSQEKNSKVLAAKMDSIVACIKDCNAGISNSMEKLAVSLSNLTESEKALSEIVKTQSEPIINAIAQVGKTTDAKLDGIVACIKDSNTGISNSMEKLAISLSDLTESEKALSEIVKTQSEPIVNAITKVGKTTDAKLTETASIYRAVGEKFDSLSNKFDGISNDISNKINNVSESIANKMKESSDEFSDILTGKIESMISKTNEVIEKIDEDVVESMQENFARISKSFEEISDATESLQKADEEEKKIIKMLEKMK